jgi:hypothetical protein
MTTDPTQQVFWLASRAVGIVAIALLGISVALGLAMSTKLLRRPGLPAKLKRFHEASTLVTLTLIVAHAGLLLADGYLRPGLAGVALPFHLSYRPLWTGTGIIAAWLAAILGLSFYARKWIGAKTWRWMHRGHWPSTSLRSVTPSAPAPTAARPGCWRCSRCSPRRSSSPSATACSRRRHAGGRRTRHVNPSAAMPRRAERRAREPPNDQGTSPD